MKFFSVYLQFLWIDKYKKMCYIVMDVAIFFRMKYGQRGTDENEYYQRRRKFVY